MYINLQHTDTSKVYNTLRDRSKGQLDTTMTNRQNNVNSMKYRDINEGCLVRMKDRQNDNLTDRFEDR